MIITRIGPRSNGNIEETTDRINITVGETDYVITEKFGRMKIHKCEGDEIIMHPCCSNEIEIF